MLTLQTYSDQRLPVQRSLLRYLQSQLRVRNCPIQELLVFKRCTSTYYLSGLLQSELPWVSLRTMRFSVCRSFRIYCTEQESFRYIGSLQHVSIEYSYLVSFEQQSAGQFSVPTRGIHQHFLTFNPGPVFYCLQCTSSISTVVKFPWIINACSAIFFFIFLDTFCPEHSSHTKSCDCSGNSHGFAICTNLFRLHSMH